MKSAVTEEESREQKKPGLWAKMRDDVSCVFERDPAARNRFEVLTTYPGVHAILVYRVSHGLWVRGWKYTARLLTYFARMFTNIEIHPGASIGSRFFIDHGTGVVIGETTEIGDDVTLYHGVTLGGTTWSKGKRHPTLNDAVVVGAGAKVLGPITIGKHSKVGANSVVINDVPEHRTVVGIPGKVVQTSSDAALNPYGVDLNHHLIPDPVAGAISCLLDRVRLVEREVGVGGCLPGMEPEEECIDCDAIDVCESDSNNRNKDKRAVC